MRPLNGQETVQVAAAGDSGFASFPMGALGVIGLFIGGVIGHEVSHCLRFPKQLDFCLSVTGAFIGTVGGIIAGFAVNQVVDHVLESA